jgi:hypothetical protein
MQGLQGLTSMSTEKLTNSNEPFRVLGCEHTWKLPICSVKLPAGSAFQGTVELAQLWAGGRHAALSALHHFPEVQGLLL